MNDSILSDEVPAILRDQGRRAWRRLSPPPDADLGVALVGPRGRLDCPKVADISVGGLAVSVSRWRARRLGVGDMLRVELRWPGRTLVMSGRLVHIRVTHGLIRRPVHVGIELDWRDARPGTRGRLVEFLRELVQAHPSALEAA